jgi:NAD(P)-dependent dehydrogenase (short-subunit alcohol dehydrogenase family)
VTELPVVIVTGGAGALGTAMRRVFGERGYRAICVDIRPPADATEGGGGGSPEEDLSVVADVSSFDAVRSVVERVLGRFGRIDVLVNNAGVANRTPTESLTEADWRGIIDVHLTGAFICSQAVHRSLVASDRAAIVNISSVVGHLGLPRRAAYSAAKAGIEGLTRSLAVEWAADGIRVNAVAPGYIRTPHHEEMFARGILSEDLIQGRTPLGDLGMPDDIACAVAFLASPEARYVTGQTLLVDGGLSIAAGIDPPSMRPPDPTTGGSR